MRPETVLDLVTRLEIEIKHQEKRITCYKTVAENAEDRMGVLESSITKLSTANFMLFTLFALHLIIHFLNNYSYFR